MSSKDNPTANVAGNQHWGHATSPDLYHWTNQPIALYAFNESSYVFSGSAVVDANNTSGFFPDQDNGVVAIFTIATYAPVSLESQGIAYSRDGGFTFELYANNPVLDIGSNQFRDPKVLWHVDHWVMVIAYAQDFVIGLFTSPDLKSWTHASNFSHHGLLGLQYECPNLVEIPLEDETTGQLTGDTTWLLQISINPGSPQGGSSSQYFLGSFDGFTFTPSDSATRVTDFAKDAYAGQFFSGLSTDEPAVSMAWASNWEYAQDVPTGPSENWRSAMGLPRAITARRVPRLGLTSIARPYALEPVIGAQLAKQSVTNGSVVVDLAQSSSSSGGAAASGAASNAAAADAVLLNITVSNLPPAANLTGGTVNMTFLAPETGETLRAGYMLAGDNYFWLDRGGAVAATDGNIFFTDKFAANSLPSTSVPGVGVSGAAAGQQPANWSMTATLDRSLFETFLFAGALTSTSVVYPRAALSVLSVASSGMPAGSRVDVEIYALRSTWSAQEDAMGTVRGNVTMAMGGAAGNATGGVNGTSVVKGGRRGWERERRVLYEAAFSEQ